MGWKEDLEERRKKAEEARKKAGRSRAAKSTKSFADIMENIQKTVTEGLTKQTAANKKKKADADKKYGVTVTKTTVKTTDPFEGLDMSKKVDMPLPKSKPKKAEPKKDTYEGEPRNIAEAKRMGKSYFINKAGEKLAAVTKEELDKSGMSLREYLNKKAGKAAKGMYATKNRTGAHDYRQGGMLMSVEDRRKMK